MKTKKNRLDRCPDLAKECDNERNREFSDPSQIIFGTEIIIALKCPMGHTFHINVLNHTDDKQTKCPYCSDRQPYTSSNDLATKYPFLAKEWSAQNYPTVPSHVASDSHKYYWWVCENGHEYFMSLRNRINGGTCPECKNTSTKH